MTCHRPCYKELYSFSRGEPFNSASACRGGKRKAVGLGMEAAWVWKQRVLCVEASSLPLPGLERPGVSHHVAQPVWVLVSNLLARPQDGGSSTAFGLDQWARLWVAGLHHQGVQARQSSPVLVEDSGDPLSFFTVTATSFMSIP